MRRRVFVTLLMASIIVAGCEALAGDWPDRRGRRPDQILLDLVQHQQLRNVRRSVGELAGQCFTERDLEGFRAARTPEQLVQRLKRDPDFAAVADALRTLPPDRLSETMRVARRTARPTWREMGFIDRQGRGQTEAGHQGDLLVAAAIVDAFASALDNR